MNPLKRIGFGTLAIALLVSFCSAALAADQHKKLTPQQKLEIWLAAPANQQWNYKATQKLIGEKWWQLMRSLPLNQAEKMWPATVATHKPSRMADVAHLLARKQKDYASAKAYWLNKLKTPKGASKKEAKLYARARRARYQLTRVLLYYAHRDKSLTQDKINKEALEITGGKIQRADYGVRLLTITSGKAKATLLLNAIDQYGDHPRQMNRYGGLLKMLKKEIRNGNITKAQALKVVTKAKQRTDKQLAKTKPTSKHYAALKKYDAQITTAYNKLKNL